MKKAFFVPLILILFSGCVNVRSIPYENKLREPKPESYEIEIVDVKDIYRPYKIIGLVDANAGKRHNTQDVMQKLKNAAKQMGGDALIELQNQPIGGGLPIQGGTMYSGHIRDLWKAKVIVWGKPD